MDNFVGEHALRWRVDIKIDVIENELLFFE